MLALLLSTALLISTPDTTKVVTKKPNRKYLQVVEMVCQRRVCTVTKMVPLTEEEFLAQEKLQEQGLSKGPKVIRL